MIAATRGTTKRGSPTRNTPPTLLPRTIGSNGGRRSAAQRSERTAQEPGTAPPVSARALRSPGGAAGDNARPRRVEVSPGDGRRARVPNTTAMDTSSDSAACMRRPHHRVRRLSSSLRAPAGRLEDPGHPGASLAEQAAPSSSSFSHRTTSRSSSASRLIVAPLGMSPAIRGRPIFVSTCHWM